MLRIGFANKYFTLWNVDERTEYRDAGGVFLPFQKIYFHYIKNLAMDEKKAKTKAIFEGVEDFNVDHDLRGKTSSFSSERAMFSKMPTDKSPFFEFGKYSGQKITAVEDRQYLFWYYQESQNIHCRRRLLDEFGFKEWNDQIVEPELFEQMEYRNYVRSEILETGEGIGRLISNLDENGVGRVEFNEEIFFVKFPEFGLNSYRGFDYYVPMKDGKQKRIKGKFLHFKINGFNLNESHFEIAEFEVLKKQIIY